jgi:hypothetical protein
MDSTKEDNQKILISNSKSKNQNRATEIRRYPERSGGVYRSGGHKSG